MSNWSSKLLRYSLFFFFVCSPLESISIGESFSLAKLTAIIVLIMWAINGFPLPKTRMINAFVLFVGYALLTVIWSINRDDTINRFLVFLIPSLLVAIALSASISSKRDVVLYMGGYVVGCLIATASGFYFRDSILNNAIIASQERITAFGADQNALAFLLSTGIACLFSFLSGSISKRYRLLVVGGVGLFLLMILSTGSRTGLILAALVIGSYILTQRRIKSFIFFAIILVVTIPFVLNFLPESILDRLLETDTMIASGDFSDRGVIWSHGINALFQENFILGVGYSNFSNMLYSHFNSSMASHNTYLTYLSEFGLMGFPLFLYLIFLLWQYSYRISKASGNGFIYVYVILLMLVMFVLETEYKRWIFIIGIMLESWYNLIITPMRRVSC